MPDPTPETQSKLTANQIYELQIKATAIVASVSRIAADRDEYGFLALCDEALEDGTAHYVCGAMRAYKSEDEETFDWMMYVLSHNLGYEDLAALFWVAHWRIKMGIIPQN